MLCVLVPPSPDRQVPKGDDSPANQMMMHHHLASQHKGTKICCGFYLLCRILRNLLGGGGLDHENGCVMGLRRRRRRCRVMMGGDGEGTWLRVLIC